MFPIIDRDWVRPLLATEIVNRASPQAAAL